MREKKLNRMMFGVGLILVLIMFIPYIILKDNSIIQFHDQLDGEVIGYILHAKYLFTGNTSYQEMMNGIPATGLTPPAMAAVLLYKVFKPLTAFVLNNLICALVGFIGMYKLVQIICKNDIIAGFIGVLFAYLPLFSVYGLAQWGIPLLIVALINLYKKDKKLISFIYIAIYGFYSSLVLVGYAILGFGVLGLIYLVCIKSFKKHIEMLESFFVLLGAYLLTNLSLLGQIFGIGELGESHKSDIVRYGMSFLQGFKEVFYSGTLHTPSLQKYIVIISVLVLVVICIKFIINRINNRSEAGEEKVLEALFAGLFFFQVFCCTVYGVTHTVFISNLRNLIGGIINEFQFDRVFWLTVPVWYVILAIIIKLLWIRIENSKQAVEKILYRVIIIAVIVVTGCNVLLHSDFKKNVARLVKGENYKVETWLDFYATDVFDQIKEYVDNDYSSYRVLSFEMYPAAALYNGFYCLDGYSNNYLKSYKNDFREIIAGELDQDKQLEYYYDQWGCRCYLLSHEFGTGNYMIPKNSGRSCSRLSIDTRKAKEMGAKYIFSAVKIENAKEINIELVREEPFKTAESFIELYVYEIN